MKKQEPIFTIITPTIGRPSILKLKAALSLEIDIPFIHIILWDKNKYNGEDAVRKEDLVDERTFCYEFNHPYHEYPKQRNDVYLRAVGISITNTPFITFFDEDTFPEPNHLNKIFHYMINNKLDYTYCKRRMWRFDKQNSNSLIEIGIDDFEAIGIKNAMGYRLIDNSSLYMRIETARQVIPLYLSNQIYGDDRLVPDFLDGLKNVKGTRMMEVLVNHIAKPSLDHFFINGISLIKE